MYIYLVYNPKQNYTISHSVFLMHEQFNLLGKHYKKKFNFKCKDISKLFNESDLQIDSLNDFIIENTKKPGKIIFFGRFFLTKRHLFNLDFLLKIKKNHEVLLWLDDLQKLYYKDVLKLENFDKSNDFLINKNINLIDKIITPSIIFFKNIQSPLLNKSIFHFYSINYEKFIDITPFNERSNKIFFSGYIDSSYKSRTQLLNLLNTKKQYKNRIYHHKHPGYNLGNSDPNYFKTIQNYKYSFIGLVKYPMNYCISKIIETLACGTLAFIDYSPLLKDELGLIPYQHYIPVVNKKLIINFNKLDELREKNKDKIIAENGRQHVLVNFDLKLKILELIKKLNNH